MGTILKHSVLGSVIGLVLALVAWLTWWLGSIALGAATWDELPALGLAVAVGGIGAGIAGGFIAFLNQGTPKSILKETPKPMKPARGRSKKTKTARKRRRHPLDRQLLGARVTPTLRWQALSKAFAHLLGLTRKHSVGAPVFDSLHLEDVPAVAEAFKKARSSREVQQVLCRFRGAPASGAESNGKKSPRSDTDLLPTLTAETFVTVRIDIWAKLDRAGAVIRYDCRYADLTPLAQQNEKTLRVARTDLTNVKSRLRIVNQDLDRLKLSYRELYQHAPVMYFSMDSDGRLVTFNDTLIETLGYERRELQDQQYYLLLPPATRKSYVTIAEAMPSRQGKLETQWCRKNGDVIHVWVDTIPVYDEAGQFVRYRSAALDLTEKSRLANELRARGDELERTNQRLLGINSELEAFTHVVAHDLKEPLRTLQACSQFLAEEYATQLGADGFDYINRLIENSRRLGTLIDDLLNFSRAGRVTPVPKAFNLNKIVATVRQDLIDLIQRKEATLLTEGSLPDVAGDPARITQLLTNLVTNALRYNESPQPRVVIGAMPCVGDAKRVTVYVRDNGIGIDKAFHTEIFGIFRRLHKSEKYEGTGAGLAICKKIVEVHNGEIWVESQLGHGATFFFTLPRLPKTRPVVPHNGAAQQDPGETQPSSRQRKTAIHSAIRNGQAAPHIVLVEDQADVGMIVKKLGQRDGLAITWFPTAEEAWDYFRERGADLLLLDVNLPGMSGVELCQRIRVLDHLKDTPVAMFTPDQDPEKLEELRVAGADYFLTKDLLCQPVQWQQKIQELLLQIKK